MKKILAIALAMVLALSLSVATFAATAELDLNEFYYDAEYYFDKNLNWGYTANDDFVEEYGEEFGITDATLLFPVTFEELGNYFTCTNHGDCGVKDYDFFKTDDDEFATKPVINAKLTTNDKYAEFVVIDMPADEEQGIPEGFILAVTPIDLYIAKDIEIEGQFYVIRNLAKKAHKSPVVTFTMTLTNPYISDNDIEVVAGESEVALYLDAMESYVVKTAQFAEAGENGLTFKFTVLGEELPITVELPSVVGQNGVNFGIVEGFATFEKVEGEEEEEEPEYERVVEGAIPESVLALSETASWFGMGFGSKEAIVNGGKVNIGGEEGIPVYVFAQMFGLDLHEDECNCEYCEFETPTDLYYYLLDAEGKITYLGSFDAMPEIEEPEESQEPEIPTVTFEWEVEAGDALGMLLISDEKFETNAAEDEESSEPEEDKEAPSTGSSEMISVAVAFAAVTVVAAGALSFKKTR